MHFSVVGFVLFFVFCFCFVLFVCWVFVVVEEVMWSGDDKSGGQWSVLNNVRAYICVKLSWLLSDVRADITL